MWDVQKTKKKRQSDKKSASVKNGRLELIGKLSGEFSDYPKNGKTWRVRAFRYNTDSSVLPNTKILNESIASILRLERRQDRVILANNLFNKPATHHLRLEIVKGDRVAWLWNGGLHLKYDSIDDRVNQIRVPKSQLAAICKTLKFIIAYEDDDELKLRASTWPYAIPGHTSNFFWTNVIMAKYCDLWGK